MLACRQAPVHASTPDSMHVAWWEWTERPSIRKTCGWVVCTWRWEHPSELDVIKEKVYDISKAVESLILKTPSATNNLPNTWNQQPLPLQSSRAHPRNQQSVSTEGNCKSQRQGDRWAPILNGSGNNMYVAAFVTGAGKYFCFRGVFRGGKIRTVVMWIWYRNEDFWP